MRKIGFLHILGLVSLLLVPFYYTYDFDFGGAIFLIFFIWLLEFLDYYKDRAIIHPYNDIFKYRTVFNPMFFGSLYFMVYHFEQIAKMEYGGYVFYLLIALYILSWLLKYVKKPQLVIAASIFLGSFKLYTLLNSTITSYLDFALILFYAVSVVDYYYYTFVEKEYKELSCRLDAIEKREK